QAPAVIQRTGTGYQQAVDHAEVGKLGRRTDEQRDGGRCAVIDVGQPHVERRGTELEGDAGNGKDHAGDEQRRLRGRAGRGTDRGEVERAGRAVDQRQAVQDQARGQRTQYEVLDGRFRGDRAVAVDGDQCVRAQRQ